MFSAELGMAVSRLGRFLVPVNACFFPMAYDTSLVVLLWIFLPGAGGAAREPCRGPGRYYFGARLVSVPEALAGRRLMVRHLAGWWISFREVRLGDGVPGRA